MAPEAHLVRERPELEERRFGEEPVALRAVEPLTREDLVPDLLAGQFQIFTTL